MRYIKRTLGLLVVFLLIVCICFDFNVFAIAAEQNANEIVEVKQFHTATIEDDFAENRLIVVFNKETSKNLKNYSEKSFPEISVKKVTDLTASTKESLRKSKSDSTIFDKQDTESISNNYNQIVTIELKESGKQNVLDAIKCLEDREDILYVGPDYVIRASSTNTNDEFYDEQWALEKIQAPEAWDITTGSSSVLVGVLDSGIDGNHEDLSARIHPTMNRDFLNGIIQAVTVPTDPNGHGTHVAGIIGAQGNNGDGVSGVCWNVKLVSLRILDASLYGYSSYAVNAIDYATAQNIPILNMSGGWYWFDYHYDVPINTVIANYPGLFVCAAGNRIINLDEKNHYPAVLNLSNMISVANTDSNDELYWDTNYGASTVHLAAPGTDIYNCVINSDYDYLGGTSQAAPHVAGVAALILSIRPDLSATEVKKLILDNVDKVAALNGKCITGGRLNAFKAVQAATAHDTFTGDVNGDGRADMILSRNVNGKRAITTFLGKSDGSFTEPLTTVSARTFVFSDPAFVGDFNGDGLTDVVIHWRDGNIKRQLLVYISKGNGTFYEAANLSSIRVNDSLQYPCSIHVNDINGDGKDDFVVFFRSQNGYKYALVYKGKATAPYFDDASSYALATTDEYRMNETAYTGDFNGDGRGDMLVHRSSSTDPSVTGYRQTIVYLGNTNGTFSQGAMLTSVRAYDLANYPSKFFVADVHGNGRDDFIVHWRNYNGKRSNIVYSGATYPAYLIDTTANALSSAHNYIEKDPVYIGDVNGDSRDDMIVQWGSNNTRQLLIYRANADGTYHTGVNCSTVNGYNPGLYADMYFVDDVNGDGRDDFIVKWKDSVDGRVKFLTYLGAADGTFTAAVRTEPSANIPYYS